MALVPHSSYVDCMCTCYLHASAQCSPCKCAELRLYDFLKTRQKWLLPDLEKVGSCLDAA